MVEGSGQFLSPPAVPLLVPLVVVRRGSPIRACLAHKKSAQKTLETGVLWEVHPATGALVPAAAELRIASLRDMGGWYLAEAQDEARHEAGSTQDDSGAPRAAGGKAAPVFSRDNKKSGETNHQDVLQAICDLAVERKKSRPEGSYTAHLFNEGEQKIRKKVGEEAVEVVLAQTEEDMANEIADLFYHLAVLLAEKNIPLSACLAKLEARRR